MKKPISQTHYHQKPNFCEPEKERWKSIQEPKMVKILKFDPEKVRKRLKGNGITNTKKGRLEFCHNNRIHDFLLQQQQTTLSLLGPLPLRGLWLKLLFCFFRTRSSSERQRFEEDNSFLIYEIKLK